MERLEYNRYGSPELVLLAAFTLPEPRRGGKLFDVAPTKWKFLKALVSRSGKVDLAKVNADNLQAAVDIAAAGKLATPVVQAVFLA